MDLIAETYSEIAAAIGWTAMDGFEVVDESDTDNLGLVLQGFTNTLFVIDSHGVKWTVHENPQTGLYTGAHKSRGTRKEQHRRRRW